ncbi:MAG: hypothetical protein ACON35_01050 [Candidatus Marinamargulisbacteria bacterium]
MIGFPLKRTTSLSVGLSQIHEGTFKKNGQGGRYLSQRGSELNLTQKTNAYRYEWASGYAVTAELPLNPYGHRMVINGPVTATVTINHKPYRVALQFANHHITSVSSKNSWFNQQLKAANLVGKPAAHAVHHFLVRQFWWGYMGSTVAKCLSSFPVKALAVVLIAVLISAKSRIL